MKLESLRADPEEQAFEDEVHPLLYQMFGALSAMEACSENTFEARLTGHVGQKVNLWVLELNPWWGILGIAGPDCVSLSKDAGTCPEQRKAAADDVLIIRTSAIIAFKKG